MATSVEAHNHHATASGAHHPDPPGLAVSSDTIKEHFDRLDTDHDGAITCDEFIQAFSQRTYPPRVRCVVCVCDVSCAVADGK